MNAYIPPEFVPDEQVQSNKGVMIGGDSTRNIESQNKSNAKSNSARQGSGSGSNSDTASKTNDSSQSKQSSTDSSSSTESRDNKSTANKMVENVTYVEGNYKPSN